LYITNNSPEITIEYDLFDWTREFLEFAVSVNKRYLVHSTPDNVFFFMDLVSNETILFKVGSPSTLADQYITICHETYSAAEHCIIKIIGPDCKVISYLKEVDQDLFQAELRLKSGLRLLPSYYGNNPIPFCNCEECRPMRITRF
jgi:hypothetical protein